MVVRFTADEAVALAADSKPARRLRAEQGV
jgi:hypothetical protein